MNNSFFDWLLGFCFFVLTLLMVALFGAVIKGMWNGDWPPPHRTEVVKCEQRS